MNWSVLVTLAVDSWPHFLLAYTGVVLTLVAVCLWQCTRERFWSCVGLFVWGCVFMAVLTAAVSGLKTSFGNGSDLLTGIALTGTVLAVRTGLLELRELLSMLRQVLNPTPALNDLAEKLLNARLMAAPPVLDDPAASLLDARLTGVESGGPTSVPPPQVGNPTTPGTAAGNPTDTTPKGHT
jgi:hypothetical protein